MLLWSFLRICFLYPPSLGAERSNEGTPWEKQ